MGKFKNGELKEVSYLRRFEHMFTAGVGLIKKGETFDEVVYV